MKFKQASTYTIKCMWHRDRPRFFDQVGHQTTKVCLAQDFF